MLDKKNQFFVQRSVKEDDLPDFLCIYQTLVLYRDPHCVIRTGLDYRPWTFQQYVLNLDAMWYSTTNGWTKLNIRKDMKSPMSIQSYVKLQFKVDIWTKYDIKLYICNENKKKMKDCGYDGIFLTFTCMHDKVVFHARKLC